MNKTSQQQKSDLMNYQFQFPLNPKKTIQYLKMTFNILNFELVFKNFFEREEPQGKRP